MRLPPPQPRSLFSVRAFWDREGVRWFSIGGANHGLRLEGVADIVAVAYGEGGVGKSTTAVNLAVALAKECRLKVGLLDADIYGPSIPTMMKINRKPEVTGGSIIITSLRNITEIEGLRGLYRGLSPSIIALLPNWAVLIGSYVSQIPLEVRIPKGSDEGAPVVISALDLGCSQAYEDLANRIVKKLKKEAVEPSPVLN